MLKTEGQALADRVVQEVCLEFKTASNLLNSACPSATPGSLGSRMTPTGPNTARNQATDVPHKTGQTRKYSLWNAFVAMESSSFGCLTADAAVAKADGSVSTSQAYKRAMANPVELAVLKRKADEMNGSRPAPDLAKDRTHAVEALKRCIEHPTFSSNATLQRPIVWGSVLVCVGGVLVFGAPIY